MHDTETHNKDILLTVPLCKTMNEEPDIAYRIIGTGEPLVLIQGLGGTMNEWDRKFLSMLAEHYQLIIFDNRGIGDSGGSDLSCSIPLMAEDIIRLIKARGLDSVSLFGYSMGTAIALELERSCPTLVKNMVLYGPFIDGNALVDRIAPYIDTSLPEIIRFNALFPKNWIKAHPDLSDIFPLPFHPINSLAIFRQIGTILEYSYPERDLAHIRSHVLVIVGERDMITPFDQSQRIASLIPGRFISIPDGGHGVIYQNPHIVAQITKDFLTDPAK